MSFARTCLGLVAAACVGLQAHTEAATTRQDFNTLLQAIQSLTPRDDDFALREKLLVSVRSLGTTPGTPPEAERLLLRARAMIEMARDDADIEAADDELQKAVRLAPWVPELAYNLAVVREQQGYYDSAAKNLKLYLLSNPEDAAEITEKIITLEVRFERDKLAAARERCALGAACQQLLHLAPDQPDPRARYAAFDFACRRGKICTPLGVTTLFAAIIEVYKWTSADVPSAEAYREMGASLDPHRAVALLVEDCRNLPALCGAIFVGNWVMFQKVEAAVTGKTAFVDAAFASAATILRCPTTAADCMVEGMLTQFGLGRKRNEGAAKRLYDTACKANIEEGCRLRRVMGR